MNRKLGPSALDEACAKNETARMADIAHCMAMIRSIQGHKRQIAESRSYIRQYEGEIKDLRKKWNLPEMDYPWEP